MTCTVLIPVKSLRYTKSRLLPVLSLQQRKQLTLALLNYVIRTLEKSSYVDKITVVTSDHTVIAAARQLDVSVFCGQHRGLNPALQEASAVEKKEGTNFLLILFADLPFLHTKDINTLIRLEKNHDFVLATAKRQTGTNALLVKTSVLFPLCFGRNSLHKFIRKASTLRLSFAVYNTPSLSFDIDTPDDLQAALKKKKASFFEFLTELSR